MDHVEVVMILVWFLYCNNYMEINLKKIFGLKCIFIAKIPIFELGGNNYENRKVLLSCSVAYYIISLIRAIHAHI